MPLVRRLSPQTIVLAIVLTCQLMIVLDASIVFTALPEIHSDLHFSATGLSWVQNAYVLTFGGLPYTQDPDQLVNHMAEGQPLGGDGGGTRAEVKPHLVAEHAEGVDLLSRRGQDRPRRFAYAVIPHVAQQVEILLHGPNSLTAGERELIATYVSSENDCYYCQTIHGAIAAASLGDNEVVVKKVKHDFEHAEISEKLKALLVIAGQVQRGGKQVTTEAVARARDLGAIDLEIHDTVLIAAAFCMFNRYVDGLATTQPRDEAMYRERGKRIAREGYINISKEYLPAEIAD